MLTLLLVAACACAASAVMDLQSPLKPPICLQTSKSIVKSPTAPPAAQSGCSGFHQPLRCSNATAADDTTAEGAPPSPVHREAGQRKRQRLMSANGTLEALAAAAEACCQGELEGGTCTGASCTASASAGGRLAGIPHRASTDGAQLPNWQLASLPPAAR